MRSIATLGTFLLAIASQAVTVSVYVSPARCGLNNGSAHAQPEGGLPPYTFSWSTGETTSSINNLAPGDYTVTVTDALAGTAQGTVTVLAVFELAPTGFPSQLQPDCQGACTGIAISDVPAGGTLPYNYPPNVIDGGFQITIMGICAGFPMPISITDANGCPGTIDLSGAVLPVDPATVTVQATSPACAGQSNGSMTVLMDGPAASVMQVTRIGGGYDQTHYPAWNVPYTITGMPAGDYDLVSMIQGGGGTPLCSNAYSGTVPQINSPCGGVSGRVYHDADQDCSFNGFDLAIPNKVLEVNPGPSYAITDWEGNYTTGLLFGNFSIGQALVNETQLCPGADPQPFTLDAGNPQAVVDFANLSNSPHDLVVSMHSSAARPGFPTSAWVNVLNNSAYPSGDVTIDLAFDPLLLNPAPASGQWNVGVIPPYTMITRTLTADVPANINLLGTVLSYAASVSNTISEPNTANNMATELRIITGSYDPNDKQGETSSALSGSQYFLDQDDWIDYTVRFQNTGTDTAFTVQIRDEIDIDLDLFSLQVLGASHAYAPSFGEGRELIFTFEDILLPDSTTDLLGSQGFIRFRLKPNDDVLVGDELENTAGIYFDFNPPIITNTVTHIVDFSTGIGAAEQDRLRLAPNPVQDALQAYLPRDAARVAMCFGPDGRMVHVPIDWHETGFIADVSGLSPGAYVLRTELGAARFTKH